ncbi:hypothetical protein ACIRQP_14915 [Streptomyces sp. NPDC102274]
MHAAFAALASASMVAAYCALDRMRPSHSTALAVALGFIAGCALATALA